MLGGGLMAITAGGGLDAGWAACRALTAANGLRGGAEPFGRRLVAPFSKTRTSVMPVVHENGQLTGRGVDIGGYPANVPTVAGGEQRQQPDRGVLGGVCGPRQVDAPVGQAPPPACPARPPHRPPSPRAPPPAQ